MQQVGYRSHNRRRRQSSSWMKLVQALIVGVFCIAVILVTRLYYPLIVAMFPAAAPAQVAQPTAVIRPTAVPVIRPAIIVPGAPPAAQGEPTPLPLVAPVTNEAPAVYVAPATISDERREQLNSVEAPATCVNCQSAAPVEQQPVMSGRMSSGEVTQPTAVPVVVEPAKELNRRQLTFDGKGSSQK